MAKVKFNAVESLMCEIENKQNTGMLRLISSGDMPDWDLTDKELSVLF